MSKKNIYNKKQARKWFNLVKGRLIQIDYGSHIDEAIVFPLEFVEDGNELRSVFIDKNYVQWGVDRGFETTNFGKWFINRLYDTKLGRIYYDSKK
jgi:hypothetical protein